MIVDRVHHKDFNENVEQCRGDVVVLSCAKITALENVCSQLVSLVRIKASL
jgi:hypothetical protein